VNAAQATAFQEGTGGSFSAADLLWGIQAIGATVAILYVAWVCYTAYVNWGDDHIKDKEMLTVWARSVFVLSVILYLLIN
jgi:integrating conjugative element protein (TIGR03758 family)